MWTSASIEETEKGPILTFGNRVYIPRTMRKDMLNKLHATHLSADRMWATIRDIWFWPGLRNNVTQLYKECSRCQEWETSKTTQPPQKIPEDLREAGPMDKVGVDIFHFGGKNYLIMTDYFSGYKWSQVMKRMDTAEVTRIIESWFNGSQGLPRTLRADSGPQFRNPFNQWLEELGIIRETSSAYNPASNGAAEKAVQDVKKVLKKQDGKADIGEIIAGLNNTVRTTLGITPAELFIGRKIRTKTRGSMRREVDLARAKRKRIQEQERMRERMG